MKVLLPLVVAAVAWGVPSPVRAEQLDPHGVSAEAVTASVRSITDDAVEESVRDLVLTTESLDGAVSDAVTTKARTLTIASDVLFPFGKHALTPRASKRIADLVAETQEDVSIEVTGYTDSIGDTASNIRLSTRRAEAVRAELEQLLPDASFTVRGRGEADPVAPNTRKDGSDNPEGRARNRRVEIVIARH